VLFRYFVAALVFILGGTAIAQSVCAGGNVVTATARLTEGSWRALPDAGFRWSACGEARTADGGYGTLPQPCIVGCEPGAFNNAPAVCVAKWKAANGIP